MLLQVNHILQMQIPVILYDTRKQLVKMATKGMMSTAFKISDPELGAAGTVFSLNFSSAGKGPFMASKAKNMCHRLHTFLGEAGDSGERDMDPSSQGHLGAKF